MHIQVYSYETYRLEPMEAIPVQTHANVALVKYKKDRYYYSAIHIDSGESLQGIMHAYNAWRYNNMSYMKLLREYKEFFNLFVQFMQANNIPHLSPENAQEVLRQWKSYLQQQR